MAWSFFPTRLTYFEKHKWFHPPFILSFNIGYYLVTWPCQDNYNCAFWNSQEVTFSDWKMLSFFVRFCWMKHYMSLVLNLPKLSCLVSSQISSSLGPEPLIRAHAAILPSCSSHCSVCALKPIPHIGLYHQACSQLVWRKCLHISLQHFWGCICSTASNFGLLSTRKLLTNRSWVRPLQWSG